MYKCFWSQGLNPWPHTCQTDILPQNSIHSPVSSDTILSIYYCHFRIIVSRSLSGYHLERGESSYQLWAFRFLKIEAVISLILHVWFVIPSSKSIDRLL